MSEFWPSFAEGDIQHFIKSNARQPKAHTPVNPTAAAHARAKIQAFADRVAALPSHEYACRQAYLDFETERLAALDLVLAGGDEALIARANDTLFGPLESMHYHEGLSHLGHHIQTLTPNIPEVTDAQARLLDAWQDIQPAPLLTANFDKIEQNRLSLRPVVQAGFGFIGELLGAYPAHRNVTSTELIEILDDALAIVLGNRQGYWRAAIKPAAPNVFIDNDRRIIVIPAGREYTHDHVRTLIIHEIGVHVERAVNGTLSRERLAGFGLAGYGAPEEAFGVLLGNAPAKSYQQINALAPFAVIEYASRPNQPDFRAVFEFTADLVLCLANPDAGTLADKSYRYQRAAFSRVWRVLRLGQPGLVERSTTKYWRGLNLISEYLQSIDLNTSTVDELLLGKYNPLNPTHLRLIKHHQE